MANYYGGNGGAAYRGGGGGAAYPAPVDRYPTTAAAPGRDPYAAPVTSQPQQAAGYYSTYPAAQKQQYDNRGYRDDGQRYYDHPGHAGKVQLPDARPAGEGGREWHTGLFGCTEDPKVCMCVWCCSPWYQMYRAHEFGESCWDFSPCCLGVAGATLVLRHRMRERENINGSLMKDCFAITCCSACASCQLFRENDIVRGGGPQAPNMNRY